MNGTENVQSIDAKASQRATGRGWRFLSNSLNRPEMRIFEECDSPQSRLPRRITLGVFRLDSALERTDVVAELVAYGILIAEGEL